ncbi:MAG: imidazole glycerol phosphate synthase subunit HisF [Rhizobiaceae bacterium]|uniref:AglZ/HisF2 family acetamidino modification protein n=1 Tax=Parvibaculum sp. TaxID=2024848 RepID=UPI001B246385|nr:AglZ/HisF2 family acetamidino modification protein [Parvibaculum sp.]MBO6633382.1 imidazole glycerol phosphate synthase subunit HisF [Parvibaculum sp.]MBO6725851.1 imidazole glycerol phosphate synthase subunit HisF [Rhizobiaceae bacterium]
MYRPRVIPCLLLRGRGLVKTRKFKDAVYVGDPVNAVRIFSEKEADELTLLDIDASREGREPNFELIEEIAGECLMPIGYGGGITNIGQVRRLIRSGVEKVIINSAAALGSMTVITEAAAAFGSQAVVGAVDVRHGLFKGYRIAAKSGTVDVPGNPEDHVRSLVAAGAGEILVNNIDADGTMAGFDLNLITRIVGSVDVPVVACGGAGRLEHLSQAIREGGASAVSAGSMFVFHGKRRAVLINYNPCELVNI